ncbi:unnamed protein product [Cylicostephanus goldi]|uniref:Uncharacterized protein n=2 Tax=Strongylidae TaxID=27830 RepID=A0A3P6SW42_CYLGO|nr:unnamed protein product [Cylicostephanus goldi]
MQTTCQMIQEWDKDARKAIKRRQAFDNNIGAPGVPGNPDFSPAIPQRFAPSAQGCMNIPCICPYMGVSSKFFQRLLLEKLDIKFTTFHCPS